MKFNIFLLSILISFSVANCGGGDGSSEKTPQTVASTETFDISKAWANLLTSTQTLSFKISGSTNGVAFSGSGTLSQAGLTASTFEGMSALKRSETVTFNLDVSGVNIPSAATVESYFDSNYKPLGSSSGSEYEVVKGVPNLPSSAKVGDTGVSYTTNRYSSISRTTLKGTSTYSFVLEADTAITAILKLIVIKYDNSGVQTSTSIVNFRLTPSGGLTRLSEDATASGTIIKITY